METIKLEALKRRLPVNHPKYPTIVEKLNRKKIGEKGEKLIDFYLDVLDDTKYYIFHGLRLLYKNFYFQIDTLILTTKYAQVLEIKYLTGELKVDRDFGQLTCREKRYANPVAQARLQALKLKLWLEEHHFAGLPIAYLFVNTNERTKLKSENERMTRNMCNSEFVIEKLSQIEQNYPQEMLHTKELRKIKNLLLAKHTPKDPDVLKEYEISPHEISTGVECPKCHYLPMNYKYGKWYCTNCKEVSKNAHLQAINDYFLLIKPSITNAELRQFLHFHSAESARKILLSMNLPSSGTFRNRTYHQKVSPLMHKNQNDSAK